MTREVDAAFLRGNGHDGVLRTEIVSGLLPTVMPEFYWAASFRCYPRRVCRFGDHLI